MYCKFIRLISGEGIIGVTEDPCDSFQEKEFIEVTNPVLIGSARFPKHGQLVETYMFLPWMTFSSSNTVKLQSRNIVMTSDVRERIAEQYQIYVDQQDVDGEIIDNEEDLDEEEEFEILNTITVEDSSESEEDDRNSRKDRRTLH